MRKIILTVFVTLLILNVTVAQVKVQDSLALIDLYDSTGGRDLNYWNGQGWPVNRPVSTWDGVTVINNKITQLDLTGRGLYGTIPASIGNLSDIVFIILDQNNLQAIPNTIGNLKTLTSLSMDQDNLTGPIPGSLGSLPNLTYLRLTSNNLSGNIPDSLGNSPKLGFLDLDNNQLTGPIPPSINNIVSLDLFSAENNQLSDTLPSLRNLINLNSLNLTNNQLNGSINPELGDLSKLKFLLLGFNHFTGSIPENIGKLRSFIDIGLNNNELTGAIPSSIGDLTQLEYLNLTSNHLSDSIPAAIATLPNLSILNLDSNQFTFAGLENVVTKFNFTKYSPQAYVPLINEGSSLKVSVGGSLSSQTFFWYKNNILIATKSYDSSFQISAPGNYYVIITDEKAPALELQSVALTFSEKDLDSLALVDLYNNTNGQFWVNKSNWLTTAPISTWYGVSMRNNRVDSLNLSFNNLSGHLPVSIGNLTKVRDLIFTLNPITDTIPSTIGQLASVENIDFKQNQLTGSLPQSIGSLSKLNRLDLDFNTLSGNLPASIGNLKNLQHLDLSENSLQGSVPSSIGNLSNLNYLALEVNNLTGTIPSSIGNLINLDTIYLGGNKISGSIPSSFKTLKNLRYINFNSDSLSGQIPTLLDSLLNLQYLGLGGNHFSGQISDSIGNLSNLKYLILYSNQLTGHIPSSIGNLVNLQYLSLYNNHLSDSVPATLRNIINPASVDISVNNLTFSGMEEFAQRFPSSNYYPQATINLKRLDSILYVSVGGTPSNNTYKWYRNDTLVTTISADSTYKPLSNGNYFVQVTNAIATRLTLLSDTLAYNVDTSIMKASPRIEYANRQEEGTDGWTNYYYDNKTPSNYTDDTLLLSLKTNGQNIGHIGNTAFAVKLVATNAAGSNSAIKLTNPLITNPTGFWVMNRYWQVTPTHEPVTNIGVRFYYNKQDLNDVNGSYPNHNLTNQKLIFYKTIGGNPDPSTNLEGATKIISILPSAYASDTTWTYHQLTDTTQYAEFYVNSFSGGGGGGTGNNQALPIQLISFDANKQTDKVAFEWTVADEDNSYYFELQRSVNGINYETIQTVYSTISHVPVDIYNGVDNKLPIGKIQYRLKIVGKDGEVKYSKTIKINNASKFIISLNPNPFSNDINLKIQSPQLLKASVQLFDIKGRQVLQKQFDLIAGYNLIKIDSRSLAQGIYTIKLISNDMLVSLNCIKE